MDQPDRSSRRTFIKSATALTAAAAAYTGQPLLADIHGPQPKAEKLSLGVKPEGVTAGPVIVETDKQTHVTFYGCEEDKRGRDLGDGTVVISLKGCETWRLRSSKDEEVPSHSLDLDSLDCCEIYEVKNSDWKPDAATTNKLNHYVITFLGFQPGVSSGGMNFECLAEGFAEPTCIKDADFDVLVASLRFNELNNQSGPAPSPLTSPQSTQPSTDYGSGGSLGPRLN